ncbi:MAG: CoA-binding protein [Desulfobacteraceae bacterium]|nr:CoA-binding protein [Desulfobacteraceae bacterium]
MRKADHFLEGFFWPKSVAIVGATNNPFKVNFRLMQNLVSLGYEGKIYPVNPNEKEILGVRAFASLRDIPDKIDLVVTAVPASKTMDIVRECNAFGVNQLVIVAGGFSEGGERGRELHKKIASFIEAKGIRTLGPNTLTPINTSNNFVISYNPVKKLKRGALSFAFQSGFYEPKVNWIFSHLGINKMLDMGNKMDINEVDALAYFSEDPSTEVIAMHIESLQGDARDFFSILKEVSREKPTIILKSGRTASGSKAAASHTGSIARENDMIFDSMIRQTAAIRANNMEDFFDLAKAFDTLQLPGGNRLAIITLSGGEGVMATDACEMNGMKLAAISDRTQQKVKKILPPWEIPLNPFDAGVCMQFHFSDFKAFFGFLGVIPEDENVNCAIMQMPLNPSGFVSSMPDITEEIIDSLEEQYVQMLVDMKRAGKPFALWRSSMDLQEKRLAEIIESHGLPVFQSSERAIKALAAMDRYRRRSSSMDASSDISEAPE